MGKTGGGDPAWAVREKFVLSFTGESPYWKNEEEDSTSEGRRRGLIKVSPEKAVGCGA